MIKGRRIAWVGPAGEYPGEVAARFHEPDLAPSPASARCTSISRARI